MLDASCAPGGAREALDARPGPNDLTLGSRYGFVRVALQHGAHLIPVFTVGENDLYQQALPNPPGSLIRWVQDSMMQVCGVVFLCVMIGSVWSSAVLD